jgi:DNA-binding transcriptional LysR family regulator
MAPDPGGRVENGVNLTLLRTFLAVYRAGSMTRAAALLGVSQPSITAQMRALEEEWGHQLFLRLPRGIAPTTHADTLAEAIAAHIDALESVTERGSVDDQGLAGRTVHLGGPAEFLAAVALPALADLVAAGLRLRVTPGLPDELIAGIAAGRFELAITTVRPRRSGLVVMPFYDEELVLVAAPAVAARVDATALSRQDVSSLSALPLIAYSEERPLIRRYWSSVFGATVRTSPAVVIPDLRGVAAAVAEGAGWSVLPRYLCRAALDSGALVELHRPQLPPINTMSLVVRAGPLPAYVRRVRSRLVAWSRAA